jgi:hypothetical protein
VLAKEGPYATDKNNKNNVETTPTSTNIAGQGCDAGAGLVSASPPDEILLDDNAMNRNSGTSTTPCVLAIASSFGSPKGTSVSHSRDLKVYSNTALRERKPKSAAFS